jgi:hypothetical protein
VKSKNNVTIQKSVKRLILLLLYQLLIISGTLTGFLWVAPYLSPFYGIYHFLFRFIIEKSDNLKLALAVLDVPFIAIVGVVACAFLFKKTYPQLRSAYDTEPFSLIRFTPHVFIFFVLTGIVLQKLSFTYILILFGSS